MDRDFKRVVLLSLLVILSPCILCTMANWIDGIDHNIRLKQFSKALYDYPLPPYTQIISRNAEVGLGYGSGNHCQFIVEQVQRSRLSRRQIEQYYEPIT